MTKNLSPDIVQKVLLINKEVHEKYKDKLYKVVPKYRDPDSGTSLREFLEKAKESESATSEDRERINNYLNSGMIDETEEIVDEEMAREFDKELDSALLKAIEDKRLPKCTLQYIKKKTRKYVRKLKTNGN